MTDEKAPPEQKARRFEGVTTLLRKVLGKNPATTVVAIEDVSIDNWGSAGEPVTARRQRGQ